MAAKSWYPIDFTFTRVGSSDTVHVEFTFKNAGDRGTSHFNYMPIYHHPNHEELPSGNWSSLEAVPLTNGGTRFGFDYVPPSTDMAHYISFDIYAEGVLNGSDWGGIRTVSDSFITPAWSDQLGEWSTQVPEAPELEFEVLDSGHVEVTATCDAEYSYIINVQRCAAGTENWASVVKFTRDYTLGQPVGPWIPQVFEDKNTAAGGAYRYRARCQNYAETESLAAKYGKVSLWSEEYDVQSFPARSTNLAAAKAALDPDGNCSVKLTWTNQGTVGDEIEVEYSDYFSDGKNAWQLNARDRIQTMSGIPGNATQAVVTGLNLATKYGFRVVRRNDVGEAWAMVGTDKSAYTVTFTTEAPPALTAPSALRAETRTAEGSAGIRVYWSDLLGDADGYRLEYTTVKNAWTLSADDDIKRIDVNVDAYERSLADHNVTLTIAGTGLEPGKRHYFQLVKVRGDQEKRATTADGESKYGTYTAMADTPEVPAMTPTPSIDALTPLSIADGGGIRVDWTGGSLGDGETWELQWTATAHAFPNGALSEIDSVTLSYEDVGSTKRYSVTGLEPGTKYSFRIRRNGDGQTTPWSTIASATTVAAPAMTRPTGLRLAWAKYSDGIFVEVSDVPEDRDVTYDVQYSRSASAWINGASEEISHIAMEIQASQWTAETHSAVIPTSELVAGATYHVKVLKARGDEQLFAKVSAGQESYNSYQAKIAVPVVVDQTLSAPTNLAATAPREGAITLTWSGNRLGDESWELQVTDVSSAFAENAEGDITTVAYAEEDVPTVHTYTFTGLDANTAYWLRARKVAEDGRRSAWSARVKCTTIAPPKIVAPYELVAVPYDHTSQGETVVGVSLTWTDAILEGETYEIQWSTVANAWADNILGEITTITPDMTLFVTPPYEYTLTGITPGARARVRLRKLGEDGRAWARTIPGDGSRLDAYTVFADVPTVELQTLSAPTDFSIAEIRTGEGMARLTFKCADFQAGQSFEIQHHQVQGSFTNNIAGNITTETFEPEKAADTFTYTVTGLECGSQVWIRVRRREGDYRSKWALGPDNYRYDTVILAPPKADLAGLKAPTASDTLAAYATDETIVLSWLHNDEGGGEQSAYEIELELPGGTRSLTGTTASARTIDLSAYGLDDGDKVKWKVRTQGAWAGYWSPASKVQTFRVYDRPVAGVSAPETMTAYPLAISVPVTAQDGSSLAAANAPIECQLSIVAAVAHEREGRDGNTILVAEGEAVWTGLLRNYANGAFTRSLTMTNITFGQGIPYRIEAVVYTKLGMACTAEPATMTCRLAEPDFEPSATVTFDADALTCTIRPVCRDEHGALVQGVLLDVYRVEADGTCTALALGYRNASGYRFVDQRPSFGQATYRIVARNTTTGAMSHSDWSVETPVHEVVVDWSGGQVRLPWNVEWSESHDPDRVMRKYQGRLHPVAYYGSQRGHSLTVRTSLIKAKEADKLAALRKLADAREACYVREPTGLSWWAAANISFEGGYSTAEQKVSIEFARVEGV